MIVYSCTAVISSLSTGAEADSKAESRESREQAESREQRESRACRLDDQLEDMLY